MLTLYLCTLLAAAPPLELRAGATEPDDLVTLEITGHETPKDKRAGHFLFGSLKTPAHALRALLLRSTDGGEHWTEVLPEETNSEVLFLDFAGCEGRALVGWSTEGPGDLKLYASQDCGATWTRRSILPKKVWSEWPEQMSWKDGQRGTVWLRNVNVTDTADPLRALTTRDGGKSWSTPKKQPRMPTAKQRPDPRLGADLPRTWRREGDKLLPAH